MAGDRFVDIGYGFCFPMSQGESSLLLFFKVANVSDSLPVAKARHSDIYPKFQTPRKQ